jgi:exopolysaccharide biosynthesis polyprenyl glycosylphosphotransferase
VIATDVHSKRETFSPTELHLEAPEPAVTHRVRLPAAKLWLVLSDAAFVGLSIGVAFATRELLLDGSEKDFADGALAVVLAAVAILAALAQQRAYKVRYLALRRDEFARIIRAVAIGLAATIVVGFLFSFYVPQWLMLVLGTGSVLLILNREIARRIFHRLRVGGRMVRRAVVVGGNGEADELSTMLMASRELGYEVVGGVDMSCASTGHRVPGPTVVARVQQMVADTDAANVIVATSAADLETTGRLVRRLTDAGLHVEMCMPLQDIDVTRLRLRPLGRFPVLYVEPVQREGLRPAAKRVFDILVASSSLLVLLPLLAVAAIAIKLDSRGPVFFRQMRVGRDGVEFPVLKLRSMTVDAEERLADLIELNEADGPLFKLRNDPRVTRVGKYLRKLSIDELPQLWNVVRGEMSLVGPRPALPSEMEDWTADLYERLRVRPGITGMWQVNGRTDSSADDYLRLDLYYVDNWSFFMDLVLLAKTLPAVLSSRGAY